MKKNIFICLILVLLQNLSLAQDSTHVVQAKSENIILEFVHNWEWLSILLLIIIDITLFFSTIKEKREREGLIKNMADLIKEMAKTREELGREEYLNMIINTLKTAKQYNYWTSHTLTAFMTEEQKKEIYSLYKKDVDNKLLTAKDISKVKFMLEQARHGVQIRVNDLLLISTFRFQIVDDEKTVLGFARKGINESRKGILISDRYFTIALKEHFEILWNSSIPLFTYINELIADIKAEKIDKALHNFVDDWQLTDDELKEIGITRAELFNS